MKELKVGDRVAVRYVHEESGQFYRRLGKILHINELMGAYKISMADFPALWFYRAQLRLLTKKPRLEIWIRKKDLDFGAFIFKETLIAQSRSCLTDEDFKDAVRFVEAREKNK